MGVEVRGTRWDVPVTPQRTPGGTAAPEPGGPRTAEHGGPTPTWSSSSPQEGVEPQQPWEVGQVSCFGHEEICPLDTNWDKLVPQTISSL